MISIIIPFHNEEQNISVLTENLIRVMEHEGTPYEIVLVDDGSTDKTRHMIEKQMSARSVIQLIINNKRFGKGESMRKGIEKSKGDIIIFMDGDLQDDPQDIPRLLKKLHEGYDLVNGIRSIRKDTGLIKLYSHTVNLVLRRFMHSPFTDINCGFKVFRREVLQDFVLYGNNFRFLPLAAYLKGYRVAEIAVHNRPRIHGVSKFGAAKLFVGIFDTVTAYFLYRFAESPLHFFGAIGLTIGGLGGVMILYLVFERIVFGIYLYRRPALQFGVLFFIVGVQIIMTGIIGELIVYLDKRKKQS